MIGQGGLPVQWACQAVGLSRATYYRPLVDWARRDAVVIEALTLLGTTKPRWGFWKYVDRLRNTGHRWNHKRLWRVYCQLRLNLPRRTKKRVPARVVQPLDVIPQPNVVWAVDFMSDTLYGGRRFRTFNILDEGVREVVAIEVDTALPAERVIRVLEPVTAWCGQPQAIRLDNGQEFLAGRFGSWCADRGIALRYIQPGQPNQNACGNNSIERSAMRCSTPTCSSRGIRCARSVRSGCGSTTKSGPMTRWTGCPRPVSGSA